MKLLLEAGVHFGHQTRRWHPRMKSYIFTERNGIHIIDLQQTVVKLRQACEVVRDLVASGSEILFVGTKKQAQEAVEQEAKRCHMPYVNQRWLGGTLTNFATIQARIDHLVRLEDQKAKGEFLGLSKKEVLKIEEKIARMNRLMGGIKEMTKIPGALFIIDPTKEYIALAEAQRLGVAVVAIADTNCDPRGIDYPIPANDDAIRAIRLLCAKMADSVLEGLAAKESMMAEEEEEGGEATYPQGVYGELETPEVEPTARVEDDQEGG
ncbi:MAG: 30S ribosomal protein S2 [Chloroflexota bacterium]